MKTFTFYLLILSSLGLSAQCYTKMVSGTAHAIAIKQDGTLWAWGENQYGQLGDGTTADKNMAVQIGANTDWAFLALSNNHTMAIKGDGRLYAWGRDLGQKLGNGSSGNSSNPAQIGTDTNWKEVAAAEYATLAIKTNGTLWVWGENDSGILGIGEASGNYTSNIPLQLGTESNWETLSATVDHCLAIKTNGTLWAWGSNSYGQLGIGTSGNTTVNSPVQVGTGTNWKTVATSRRISLGLKTDGTLWAWGNNSSLNLDTSTSPLQIGTDTDWKTISVRNIQNAAYGYVLLTKTNGELYAWGDDEDEQLGNGPISSDYQTPTRIGTDTDWDNAFAGFKGSMGIKNNATAWSWGPTPLIGTGVGNVAAPQQITCTVLGFRDFQEMETTIYPNPVKSILHIETEREVISIVIYDMNGRICYKGSGKTAELQDLVPGIYFAGIGTENGTKIYKLIKE